MTALHPREALFAGEKRFPLIPACEHFAGTEKLMNKALELQAIAKRAFDVTLDLEDGAPAGKEPEHARMTAELLASRAPSRARIGVRVHPIHDPSWRKDVDAIVKRAGDRLAYLVLPKVTSADDVRAMAAYIDIAAAAEGQSRKIPLHVLIETHGALADVARIAQEPGIETLDFGLMDFVSSHHGAIPESCMRSPGQFEHALVVRAKADIVAASIAAGVVPSHNVTIDLKDREQTRSDAKRAREDFGFLRMWSIHPEQIDPILDAMAPGDEAIQRATRVLLAAQAKDWGPIELDGRLYDRASYRYHWEQLERAQLAGAGVPVLARNAFFPEAM
jgi:citrate lyase subunit beta/citryl-CoA lyase